MYFASSVYKSLGLYIVFEYFGEHSPFLYGSCSVGFPSVPLWLSWKDVRVVGSTRISIAFYMLAFGG